MVQFSVSFDYLLSSQFILFGGRHKPDSDGCAEDLKMALLNWHCMSLD